MAERRYLRRCCNVAGICSVSDNMGPSLSITVQIGYTMGFHWKPSMKQLHMHAISRDYDSLALKQPKHWRSFVGDFFRKVGDVIDELRLKGYVEIDFSAIDALLRAPLRCHWCHCVCPNLPNLKLHISSCKSKASLNP
jgi:aprataxin